MKHFKAIDGIRAWMAWWVVCQHMLQVAGIPSQIQNFGIRFLTMGGLGVMVFVIISGFVIQNMLEQKDEPYGIYITRRLFRIYPLYIIALMLALLLRESYAAYFVYTPWADPFAEAVFQDQEQHLQSHIGLHILLLQSLVPDTILKGASLALLGPAWSLSLEWQFYLIAPLLAALAFHRTVLVQAGACMTMAVALLLTYRVIGAKNWLYPAFLPLVVGYFLLGMATCRKLRGSSWASLSLPLALSALNIILFTPAYAYGKAGLALLPIAIWVVVIWHVARTKQVGPRDLAGKIMSLLLESKVANNLGLWSYSTYLLHIPAFIAALRVAQTLGITLTPYHRLGVTFLALPVIILLSRFTYRRIESPSSRLASLMLRGLKIHTTTT